METMLIIVSLVCLLSGFTNAIAIRVIKEQQADLECEIRVNEEIIKRLKIELEK